MLFCKTLFAKRINKNNQKQTDKEKTKKKKNFHQFKTTADDLLACSCTLAQKCIYSVQWQVLAARDWHTFYGSVLILEKFGHKLKMLLK